MDGLKYPLATRLIHLVLGTMMALPAVWRAWERTLVRLGHRFPGSRPIMALCRRSSQAVVRRRPARTSRVAVLRDGTRVAVRLNDYGMQGVLYFEGVYEPKTTAIVLNLLRPGDVFLDVGANVGYFSCLAASRGAIVHAFEPNPAVAGQVIRSGELNRFGDRLRVVRKAVSAADGRGELFLPADGSDTAVSSLLPLSTLQGGGSQPVALVSLDSYCQQHEIERIRAIKIDVEGAELDVLDGAHRVLSEVRPDAVICELSGFEDGSPPREILDRLRAAGYVAYEIGATGLAQLGDVAALSRAEDWRVRNVCFLAAHVSPDDVRGPGGEWARAYRGLLLAR